MIKQAISSIMEEERTHDANNTEYMSDASFYITDYHFNVKRSAKFLTLNPDESIACGGVIEINPCEGLYLSYANWLPREDMQRKYEIPHSFVKLYFLESGKVTLVQNGKSSVCIPQGVNIYYNHPAKGRVLYEGKTPIRYISVLIMEHYMNKLAVMFPKEKITFADISSWRTEDYDMEEISNAFIQIKEKMLHGFSSPVYYEGKVMEILSLTAQNHDRIEKNYLNLKTLVPYDEWKGLEKVRRAICKNPMSPPSIEALCKLSAMSSTKLRNLFKKTFGISLGRYVQKVKLDHSLVLLTDSSKTISIIAKQLGYVNSSKFSAIFKKYYGQSPSEYRRYRHIDNSNDRE